MNTALFAALVLIGCVLMAVAGLLIVRRLTGRDLMVKHHELAGHILSVVGTLNAVLLGMVVIEAQSRYQQARLTEAAESNALGDIRRISDSLPRPVARALQQHTYNYAVYVVEKEWESAKQPEDHALKEFSALWKTICDFKPTSAQEQNLHQTMLTSMSQLADSRRFRITNGRHGIPNVLWAALIISSVITTIFTYFFFAESLTIQVLMTILLTCTLTMNVLLVTILGNPYTGDWKIRPDQFIRLYGKAIGLFQQPNRSPEYEENPFIRSDEYVGLNTNPERKAIKNIAP